MKAEIKMNETTYVVSTEDKVEYQIKIGRKILAKITNSNNKILVMRNTKSGYFGGYSKDCIQDTIINFITQYDNDTRYIDSLFSRKQTMVNIHEKV